VLVRETQLLYYPGDSSLKSLGGSLNPFQPPRPFLKWAGGKGQLLEALLARVPAKFEAYFEAFLGGGALFFALSGERRLTSATLNDANARLMDIYAAVREDAETVIHELGKFGNLSEIYYDVRSWKHDELTLAAKAARLIYLNRTCYNGLFRENRKGEFNVPFGRYKNPRICDPPNLRSVSCAIKSVTLASLDFQAVLERAEAGDFVYLDPPYDPVSRTSSFTSYQGSGFGIEEQKRLASVFEDLDRRGVLVMLSNSDTALVRALYKTYCIEEVPAGRLINSRVDRRGKVTELIVRNYQGASRELTPGAD
jgi:DNA adenine methylase